MEARREAMMKRLANRHEERILKTIEGTSQKKIDLRATEKAFLQSSPSAVDMKTPINPAVQITELETSSPILTFDEEADKQMTAFSAWCNTMIGLDSTEELDLGATKAEACKKIQAMLKKKAEGVVEGPLKPAARRYHRIFEKNDPVKIRKQCRQLLLDCGMDESVKELLKKSTISIRSELAVYSDLALQTSLLRVFFSFHPVWLKTGLEAIFNTRIDVAPNNLIGTISRFFIDHVFSDQKMIRNKKFAQGSGKPIVTPAGKVALHGHFLLVAMKLMFLIEAAHQKGIIPNLTRIFNKSSVFKCLDDVFAELTKELLSGSSMSMKKAFAKIGFTASYKQSFIENYDYRVDGFNCFSDGLVLAKLVETVGDLPHGKLLLKLRDPAGDRIRKVNNVKAVLSAMNEIGIATDDVLPASIVGGKKEAILAVLWSIIGVRVAKEKRIRMPPRVHVADNDENVEGREKKRRSAVHDSMSTEVLETCKTYGRQLDEPVPDLDSLQNGRLLSKIWSAYVPTAPPVDSFAGDSLWDRVVAMASEELGISSGFHLNMVIFVKTFLERMHEVRVYIEKATTIQKAWRNYAFRKRTPKLYFIVRQILDSPRRSLSPRFSMNNATFTVPQTPSNMTIDRSSICSTTTTNNATFTVERVSIDRLSNVFRMPKTPARVTNARSTTVFSEVIPEEENEEQECTIVPSTDKKRVVAVPREETVRTLFEELDEALSDDVMSQDVTEEQTAEEPAEAPMEEEEEEEKREDPKAGPEVETATDDDFRQLLAALQSDQLDSLNSLPSTHHTVAEKENEQSTPELRRILRETLALKRKQQDVARKLGQLERYACSQQEMAFIESHDDDDRSMAGFDDRDKVLVLDVPTPESPDDRLEAKNAAATLIQKTIRGFLARRRFQTEIRVIQLRAAEYNQALAVEDEQLAVVPQTEKKKSSRTTSAQMKLRKCTLRGLTDDNLHIVNLSATIIDRLTDLVPSLIDTFVVELDGLQPVYNILKVADRGYSYMSILHPLLRILEKSFVRVPAETSNSTVAPLLGVLTPRLSQLLLAHCTHDEFFRPLATSLISIGRRFPNKKQSHMDKSSYFVKKAQSKVTNPTSKKLLADLEKVCSRQI